MRQTGPAAPMPAMLACCLAVLGACTPARSGARGGLASEDPHAMVEVPGGTFAMGSPEGAGESQEHPRHRVTVGPFRLDRTLVTVSAYGACVRSGACTAAGNQQRGTPGARPGEDDFCNGARPDRADHPINCVDSSQAVAYCAWVGKRLPTEEEWEWAARGPDDRKYPWGTTEPSGQLCWHRLSGDDYRHALGTCPVGAYPSGDAASGAHDMAGNVWEWTSTPWAPAYDKPGDITARVVRGGGWRDSDPSVFRGASRNGSFETDRVINLGFRCAR